MTPAPAASLLPDMATDQRPLHNSGSSEGSFSQRQPLMQHICNVVHESRASADTLD